MNVISTGVFHKDSKLVSMALMFFLINKKPKVVGVDSEDEEEEEVPQSFWDIKTDHLLIFLPLVHSQPSRD